MLFGMFVKSRKELKVIINAQKPPCPKIPVKSRKELKAFNANMSRNVHDKTLNPERNWKLLHVAHLHIFVHCVKSRKELKVRNMKYLASIRDQYVKSRKELKANISAAALYRAVDVKSRKELKDSNIHHLSSSFPPLLNPERNWKHQE